MAREPMIYGAAGVVFGFVLGYMAAGFDRPPVAPVAAPADASAAADGARPSPQAVLDPDEVAALEALARRDPKDAASRVSLGNLYMDHQRFDDAARWYGEALALHPDDVDVRVDRGASLVDGGHPADGLKEFEEALRRQPDHKKALFNKGVALMAQGQPQQAVALWEDLIKRFPDDPQLSGLRDQIARVRAQKAAGPS